ncbi:MAG: hypothetical protein R6U63_00555 [Longimicrobiales bacterium]
MNHTLHLTNPPTDLDPDQLHVALVDLCVHGFAVMEERIHARQLYRAATARRLEARLPVSIGGRWRVDLE